MVRNNFNGYCMETTLILTSTNNDDFQDIKMMLCADELYQCLIDVKRAINAKIQHGSYNDREGQFLRYLDGLIDVQGLYFD
jgi:hypothetical protein